MSEAEQPLIWRVSYKIEYPFHAIDATLSFTLGTFEDKIGATRIERNQITTGSVEYSLIYHGFNIYLYLRALDTRLCTLIVTAPQRPETEAQVYIVLDEIASTIAREHERIIAEAEKAETLIATDRSRGGRETWPEDAEAIARLQAGESRESVRSDWLKYANRNRKRKKLTDPDNRFRQLVVKAKKG